MTVLAVVPARAGSKRLPGKNMKMCAGKPLIQWTIEEAKACAEIDHILVSSDDEVTLEFAECMGVTACKRPKKLARDKTPMMPVLKHALLWAENHWDKKMDIVVLLQPTSPVRESEFVTHLIRMARAYPLPDDMLAMQTTCGSQPDGQCYIYCRSALVSPLGFMHWMSFCLSGDYPDINTQEDFDRAEAILHSRSRGEPLREPEACARVGGCGCGFGRGCS